MASVDLNNQPKLLTEQELNQLSFGGSPVDLAPETIEHNGVELIFQPQNPGRATELMLAAAEACKNSEQIERIVTDFLPQLKGKFQQLGTIAIFELSCLVIQKMSPMLDSVERK